jgi:predicted dinucleotide-binding enzyme
MKVGIIGSGQVGQVLGRAFLTEGHEVMLGTRDTTKETVVQWQKDNTKGLTGTFEEAARFGEIIVLCTAGAVAAEAVLLAGPANFAGKVVMDTTNPIAHEPPVNGVLKYFTDINESLMERTQRLIPTARMVKVFSSVGSANFYKPSFKGGTPSMFICGNDEEAKKTVAAILTVFEWETEDMGKVEAARAIEPLCILWCIPGFLENRWSHAFKLLKR